MPKVAGMATVEAVSVGRVRVSGHRPRRTAIDKRAVSGAVRIEPLGVAGDEVANRKHHGGLDQAVYAYAREDYAHWESELGRPLTPGSFGENLTTIGLDIQNARIGERWRVGEAVLEVTGVRIPCSVFADFVAEPNWVRRFTEHGVPGAYLRVIEPGVVAAGDEIQVVERRDHDLTVAFAFRAATTERGRLADLAAEERLSSSLRATVDRYLRS